MFLRIFLNSAPPVAKWFCAENWLTGDSGFDSRSRLSTYTYGVSRGFLRNSRKYGSGSLRNTPAEGIPPIVPSHKRTIGIKPTITHFLSRICIFVSSFKKKMEIFLNELFILFIFLNAKKKKKTPG